MQTRTLDLRNSRDICTRFFVVHTIQIDNALQCDNVVVKVCLGLGTENTLLGKDYGLG